MNSCMGIPQIEIYRMFSTVITQTTQTSFETRYEINFETCLLANANILLDIIGLFSAPHQ